MTSRPVSQEGHCFLVVDHHRFQGQHTNWLYSEERKKNYCIKTTYTGPQCCGSMLLCLWLVDPQHQMIL